MYRDPLIMELNFCYRKGETFGFHEIVNPKVSISIRDESRSPNLTHRIDGFASVEFGVPIGDTRRSMPQNDAGGIQSERLPQVRRRTVTKLMRMPSVRASPVPKF
jgi:hypothetical protein